MLASRPAAGRRAGQLVNTISHYFALLRRTISHYFGALSRTISHYIALFRFVSARYLALFRTISHYFALFRIISHYLRRIYDTKKALGFDTKDFSTISEGFLKDVGSQTCKNTFCLAENDAGCPDL